MRKSLVKSTLVFISCVFLLCSCGKNDNDNQSYDGRQYDISINQDKSVVATSNKLSDGTYTLILSGSGQTKDYQSKNAVPWNPISKKISSVTINEGLVNVGDYFFNAFLLSEYILPSTIKTVGDHSFNSNAIIYTFGDLLNNIDNDVYYYSETKPLSNGNYFYMENDVPQIWILKTLKFLFIGNSFTFRGDPVGTSGDSTADPAVPRYFKKIAINLNKDVDVDFVVESAYTLTKYANKDDAKGAIVEQKLTGNQYDFVILQDQSYRPLENYSGFESAVRALKKRIDETQENCRTILYETWGYPKYVNEHSTYSSIEQMELALREAYTTVGSENGCSVNYVGKAFTFMAKNHPSFNIYQDDNMHQNMFGAYLSAAVHVRSIFKCLVSGCTDYCEISDSNKCRTLLSVADQVI